MCLLECEQNCHCTSASYGLSKCLLFSVDFREAASDMIELGHKHFRLYFRTRFIGPRVKFHGVKCGNTNNDSICGKCNKWEKRKFYDDQSAFIFYGRKRECVGDTVINQRRKFVSWERDVTFDKEGG